MEPDSTFAEAARILREGGVFAAYDCDWPPVINPEAELAYNDFQHCAHVLEEQLGIMESITRWQKSGHLDRIRQSGRFRYVREILMHGVESGNAERLVGLALSQGGVESLIKLGLGDEEIGLNKLREAAKNALGDKPSTWYFSYRMRIGVK